MHCVLLWLGQDRWAGSLSSSLITQCHWLYTLLACCILLALFHLGKRVFFMEKAFPYSSALYCTARWRCPCGHGEEGKINVSNLSSSCMKCFFSQRNLLENTSYWNPSNTANPGVPPVLNLSTETQSSSTDRENHCQSPKHHHALPSPFLHSLTPRSKGLNRAQHTEPAWLLL